MSWTSTDSYTGPTKIENGVLVRDDRPLRARTVDAAPRRPQHVHIWLDQALVTRQQPDRATCAFRRDRSGIWRGKDQKGRRWLAHENGGTLYLYPDTGADPFAEGTPADQRVGSKVPVAGGGVVNPEDPGPADRRRAGDRALDDLGEDHSADCRAALRVWQERNDAFWARR